MSEVGIVAKHAYSEGYGDNPLGSGAWKVADFKKDQQLILVPNEYYYGKKPYFEKVNILKVDPDTTLAIARSGQVDVIVADSEYAAEKINGMHVLQLQPIDAFAINLPVIPEQQEQGADGATVTVGNNVTADLAIRQALNIGINRALIVQNALNGNGDPAFAARSTLPWSNGNTFNDNRLEEAIKILEDAGWIDSDGDGIREKNGLKAEITITGRSNDLERYNTVVALADNVKALGIRIIPKSAPWAECRAARAIPTCWVLGQPNPIELYRYYATSQIGVNIIGNPSSYSNAEFDAEVEKAILSLSQEEANKHWHRAQDISQESIPFLWISYPKATYFVRDGLKIVLQRMPTRGQGISIVETMNEWCWE